MDKSYGWAGTILWVDLTSREISRVPTAEFEPEKYIGGVGVNSRIFWELGCPQVSAFHRSAIRYGNIGNEFGIVFAVFSIDRDR